jgi:hypothetical protein
VSNKKKKEPKGPSCSGGDEEDWQAEDKHRWISTGKSCHDFSAQSNTFDVSPS